jgi:hypothetical protein
VLLKSSNSASSRAATSDRLTADQDLALERYRDAIDAIGFGISKKLVEAHANSLLKESHFGDPETVPKVGQHRATRRWLGCNSWFTRTKAAPMEVARKRAQQPDGIRRRLKQLKDC